jgi:hypothetical protein
MKELFFLPQELTRVFMGRGFQSFCHLGQVTSQVFQQVGSPTGGQEMPGDPFSRPCDVANIIIKF